MGLKRRSGGQDAGWRIERMPFDGAARLLDATIDDVAKAPEVRAGDLVRLRPEAQCGESAQAMREQLLRAGAAAVAVAPERPPDAVFAREQRPESTSGLTEREAVEELLAAAANKQLADYVRDVMDRAGI